MFAFTAAPIMLEFELAAEKLVLGKGCNGNVYHVTSRSTREAFAMNILADTPAARLEVEIQERCKHPRVLPVTAAYCNLSRRQLFPQDESDRPIIALVTPIMVGDELFKRVDILHSQDSFMKEDQIKSIIFQIASALEHIHSLGLIHNDVKLENVLLKCTNPACSQVKLSDFGCAVEASQVQKVAILCTPANASPEQVSALRNRYQSIPVSLLEEEYSFPSDMWSLGVMMYCMAFSSHPFQCESKQESTQRQVKGQYHDDCPWHQLSPEGQHVLRRLLCVDHSSRMTAKELLGSVWLEGVSVPELCCCIAASPDRHINVDNEKSTNLGEDPT
jgi:mitogen-activated protein kinase-activated protein kinase 2